MGCELVEGRDLAVDSDDCVYMQTVRGWTRVDVIYRRIDDDFLDPEVFRKDSSLGVPGLMRAWAAGNVALANAPGAGVADDKLVYTYVPDMIKYYLDEDAILPNVPSWRCGEAKQLDHVLGHLDELVVKPVDGSGGYGMLMGPMSSKSERGKFADSLKADPRSFIAQPVVTLSTVPTLVSDRLEPRHVDLRPVHPERPRDQRDHGRTDARGAAQGIAGGELVAGRREQGYLDRRHGELSGAGEDCRNWTRRRSISHLSCNSDNCFPGTANARQGRRKRLLAVALPGARGEHGAHHRREHQPAAGPAGRHRAGLAAAGGHFRQPRGVRQACIEGKATRGEERDVVHFLVADKTNPGSICSSMQYARENARTLREILPTEAWELLNEFITECTRDVASGRQQAHALRVPQAHRRHSADHRRHARRHHEPQ